MASRQAPPLRVAWLPKDLEVVQVRLRWSNSFLVRRGDAVLLVDAGSPGDLPAIERALRERGLGPGAVKLVVLTHGHADHAALARTFQSQGVPVLAGRGDEPMLASGRNRPLRSQNLMGRLLVWFVDFPFDPVKPDVLLDAPRALAPWGFPDLSAEPVPGHTPGSLVVFLPGEAAIVGDMVLGGVMGGAFAPDHPKEHYFQDDPEQNRRNLAALLGRGVRTFYLGHGGPVTADAVRSAFQVRGGR
jgi:glyoxylase-like metal-dependent hydrolase (beta-lactamase superfamily II)